MASPLEWAAEISPRMDKIRLGDGNNRYSETAWPDHEPSQPWAVHLASGQIYRSLALDFDHGPTYAPHVDAREAFWYLEASGFTPVLVESGGGGYHVLARLPVPTHADVIDPIVRNLRSFWPSLDISPMVNARTGCIRVPGSLHVSGGRSHVIAGSLPAFSSTPAEDTLDRLEGLTKSPPITTPATGASRSRPISDKVERLLRDGDTEKAYPSRSEMIQAIAFGYVKAGKNFDALFEALRDEANLGGEKVQRMPPRRAEQYVARSHSKALSFEPRRTTPAQVLREIEAFRRAIDPSDWSGMAGATDRTVVGVLLKTADRLGTMAFGMSLRELAERAAINKNTSGISLHRLVKGGFIRQVAPAVGRDAAIWQLQLADTQIRNEGRGRVLSGDNLQDDLPEAFRWRTGLGHNAYRIWMATTELHSRKEIADRLGLDPTTVSRNLRKLEKEGMVTHDQKTQQFSHVACDLDAVAKDLGVKGSRDRQRESHKSERRDTGAPVERNERGGITLTATRRKKKQVNVRRNRLEQGDEE